jgi:hypothetical protein
MEIARSFTEETVKDRTFEIGGEMFKWRYPYWKDIASIFDEDASLIQENDGRPLNATENIELAIKRVEMFLDPENDAVKRWRALAARKDTPVPHFQFGQLYVWLLEVTGRRPTETPTPSEDGSEKTEPTSKED